MKFFFNTISICVICAICGCSKQTPQMSSVDSPILVTVNGRAITQADFNAEAARRVGATADTILSNLVERQVMLIRAEESGIADSPAFKRETENRLISEWLATTFQKERDAVTVTEAELEAAYAQRKEQLFMRQPLTRFAVLYRKGRDIDELKTALGEAVALFETDREAATNNGRLLGFGKIAADYSEDTVSRYRGGDIGWVGDDAASRVPSEVLAAGKGLGVGEWTVPFAAGDGVWVVMKTAEREASQIAFKEASSALRRRLLAEKHASVEARFKDDLMRGVKLEHKARPAHTGPTKKPEAVPSFTLSATAE